MGRWIFVYRPSDIKSFTIKNSYYHIVLEVLMHSLVSFSDHEIFLSCSTKSKTCHCWPETRFSLKVFHRRKNPWFPASGVWMMQRTSDYFYKLIHLNYLSFNHVRSTFYINLYEIYFPELSSMLCKVHIIKTNHLPWAVHKKCIEVTQVFF